jgi:hypothetical protein
VRIGDRAGVETVYAAGALALHVFLSYAGYRLYGWAGIPAGFVVAGGVAAAVFIAVVDRWQAVPPLAATARIVLPALGACAVAGLAAALFARLPVPLAPGRLRGLATLGLGGGAFALVLAGLVAWLLPAQGRMFVGRARGVLGS